MNNRIKRQILEADMVENDDFFSSGFNWTKVVSDEGLIMKVLLKGEEEHFELLQDLFDNRKIRWFWEHLITSGEATKGNAIRSGNFFFSIPNIDEYINTLTNRK
ncbi:MAG: hypothetical protein CMP67_02380 [Flavobacteriales bacterium]|nr:hypothetical protein [Flavobacteriales bacterium]|tara:strand:+ start:494 stop:805 length:312 start_codon:yes stop_codon:yes gene_type:complete